MANIKKIFGKALIRVFDFVCPSKSDSQARDYGDEVGDFIVLVNIMTVIVDKVGDK